MGYIYKITNNINDKVYIGKTEKPNPEKRWKEHLSERFRERSSKRSLYRAMNKYGVENFFFIIIEETNNTEERELYYIQLFDSCRNGYNDTFGGDGRAYLNLNEKEICSYYQNNSLRSTALNFKCDIESVKKVLLRNKVKIRNIQESNTKSLGKDVAQLDKNTGEFIQAFPSAHQAEIAMGADNTGHISQVCRGLRKTAYGYK